VISLSKVEKAHQVLVSRSYHFVKSSVNSFDKQAAIAS